MDGSYTAGMKLMMLKRALHEADAMDFDNIVRHNAYRQGVNPEHPAFSMGVNLPGDYYPDDIADDEGRAYEYTFKNGVIYANPTSKVLVKKYPLLYSKDYLTTWKVAKNDVSVGASDDTLPRTGKYLPGVINAMKRDFERDVQESLRDAEVYYDDDGDLIVKPREKDKIVFYMKEQPDDRFYIMSDGVHKSENDFWFSREYSKIGKPNAEWHNVFMTLQIKLGDKYLYTAPVVGKFFKFKGKYLQKLKSVLIPKKDFEATRKQTV